MGERILYAHKSKDVSPNEVLSQCSKHGYPFDREYQHYRKLDTPIESPYCDLHSFLYILSWILERLWNSLSPGLGLYLHEFTL